MKPSTVFRPGSNVYRDFIIKGLLRNTIVIDQICDIRVFDQLTTFLLAVLSSQAASQKYTFMVGSYDKKRVPEYLVTPDVLDAGFIKRGTASLPERYPVIYYISHYSAGSACLKLQPRGRKSIDVYYLNEKVLEIFDNSFDTAKDPFFSTSPDILTFPPIKNMRLW